MRIVAGSARGRRIEAPEGRNTRPTLDRVRENLFNMLQGWIADSRVLDLFAGSGALSFEAISRGAVSAVLADADRKACSVQKKNAESLGFSSQVRIFCCDWHDVFPTLYRNQETFDLVFLDPPYAMTDLTEVFQKLIPVTDENTCIILEHQTGTKPVIPDGFEMFRSRSWGFCSVDFYRLSPKEA